MSDQYILINMVKFINGNVLQVPALDNTETLVAVCLHISVHIIARCASLIANKKFLLLSSQ